MKNKSILLTIIYCIFSIYLIAQTGNVGIGTTTPESSAILDLTATNKGILIPRMTKSQKEAISNPATGLMIYQTDFVKGFYYYTSTIWEQVNSNILQIDDLIDAKSDIDNYISNASVFIGSGAGSMDNGGNKNVGIGLNSMNKTTTGFNITAVGYLSLNNNTTGSQNTAIGSESLAKNNSGVQNTAIGSNSLNDNTTGNHNAAIGQSASLNNQKGNSNTSVGSFANFRNINGHYNTVIGSAAGGTDAMHSKTGVIHIGYGAGFSDTTDNKLYIENSESSTPLIWGDFANDKVKIYGTLGIGDEYNFPSSGGTFGQILSNDGSGELVWTSLSTSNSLDQLEDAKTDYSIKHNLFGGKLAGESITTGSNNVSWGENALRAVEGGNRNVALGKDSGSKNVHGNENTTLGYNSMGRDTTGSKNTVIGTEAMAFALASSNTVAVGYQAGFNTTGSGNVLLGYKAGYNETGGNNLYIDNTDTDTPLIYGNFLSDSLQINGKTRINCTSSIYDFVMTDNLDEPALIPTTANYGYIGSTDNYLYRIYSNQFYASSAANYLNWSDRRLKENIHFLVGATDRIMQIQPVQYDLKEDFFTKGRTLNIREMNKRFNQSGFIAQNLEEVYPNLVVTDQETDLKAVSYVGLIPEMVSVIQKQQKKIEDLEKTLNKVIYLLNKPGYFNENQKK